MQMANSERYTILSKWSN